MDLEYLAIQCRVCLMSAYNSALWRKMSEDITLREITLSTIRYENEIKIYLPSWRNFVRIKAQRYDHIRVKIVWRWILLVLHTDH